MDVDADEYERIIEKQATINIGTIGHVAHGKSTLVNALSGVKTVRFKNELERNITIKLGYANAKIYVCSNCPDPERYQSGGSGPLLDRSCKRCGEGTLKLVRHVSFVDCPGHEVLMATMLNGAAVMDAALLLISANEVCPQPQTAEHLVAAEIMRLRDVIIVQNKVDLVKEHVTVSQYNDIKGLVMGTVAENSPVIPISAQLGYNIDALCKHIVESIREPERDQTRSVKMLIVRTFDVNRPGTDIEELKGGVLGGSILSGRLAVGAKIRISPGVSTSDGFKILETQVVSLYAEKNKLDFAVPGGLIAVGTTLDPWLCRADGLVGSVVTLSEAPCTVCTQLRVNCQLLCRLVGTRDVDVAVHSLKAGEYVHLNVCSNTIMATVLSSRKGDVTLSLASPVSVERGDRISISRSYENTWRLIGWGIILECEN